MCKDIINLQKLSLLGLPVKEFKTVAVMWEDGKMLTVDEFQYIVQRHNSEWVGFFKNTAALKPRQVWTLLSEVFVMVNSHAKVAGQYGSNKTCKQQPLL
jgi:hypothetical protein